LCSAEAKRELDEALQVGAGGASMTVMQPAGVAALDAEVTAAQGALVAALTRLEEAARAAEVASEAAGVAREAAEHAEAQEQADSCGEHAAAAAAAAAEAAADTAEGAATSAEAVLREARRERTHAERRLQAAQEEQRTGSALDAAVGTLMAQSRAGVAPHALVSGVPPMHAALAHLHLACRTCMRLRLLYSVFLHVMTACNLLLRRWLASWYSRVVAMYGASLQHAVRLAIMHLSTACNALLHADMLHQA
jgi:hypothetical protein